MWTEFLRPQGDSSFIDFAFLATRGGLVRFYDNSLAGQSKALLDLAKYGDGDDDTNLYSEQRYPLFYRRAATYPPGTYVYAQARTDYNTFLTTRAWSLGEAKTFFPRISTENYATMLVSGFQVKSTYLEKLVRKEIDGKYFEFLVV